MKHEQRGILALLLVSSIALTMLLTFGIRAVNTSAQCEVSSVQCKYSQIILSARGNPMAP